MNDRQLSYPIPDRWSYLWFALGVALSLVTVPMGDWSIPLAFWIGSVFFIRFMRTQRRWWLAALLIFAATAVTTYLVMPAALGPVRIASTLGAALLVSLLYIADRLMVPRLPGLLATLVFPLGYTAVEVLNSATSPLGSFGTSAYMQTGNLPLMQLVALTGMWGISFLTAWPATILNWAWERRFEWPAIRRGLALYLGLLVTVLLFGQLRLMLAPAPPDTVRIAGVVAVDYRDDLEAFKQLINDDWDAFRQEAQARQDRYFAASEREVAAGAQVVVWPEMAAPSAREDEPQLIARAQEFARQQGIYLAVPMEVHNQDGDPYENKLLVFDPLGAIVLEHYKYGGVGMEGNRVNGDGVLRTFPTPFGLMSGLICWDTDYPATVLQIGRSGADILLSPSLDMADLSPLHAQMAMVRAIENGVSVVRVADSGLAAVYDPFGRTLAAMDFVAAGTGSIVAEVPIRGTATYYPLLGDLFGWLAAAGFVALIVYGVVRGRRARAAEAAAPGAEDLAPAH